MSLNTTDASPPISLRLRNLINRVRNAEWGPGVLAGIVLFVVYMITLQRIISGGNGVHVYDAGEMQVALNLWGMPHAPSYPLYVMLGAPLVALQKLIGVDPATAPSAVSLIWSLAALVVIYDLLRIRTHYAWLAGALTLVFGLVESVWLHSVIAEVYSLMLLFVALILWWVLRDADSPWTRGRWLVLATLLGFGVAHHRAVAFLVPGLAVYLWPQLWPVGREMLLTLILGTLLFVAGFLPYFYIPLYVRLGGIWYFGDPTSLDGLWTLIAASDWNYIAVPPSDLADFLDHVRFVAGVLARQWTWPGLLVGAGALVAPIFFKDDRGRLPLMLLISTLIFLGVALWTPEIVIDYPEPSGALPILLLPILALGEVLTYLTSRGRVPFWLAGGLLGAWAGVLIVRGLPFIYAETHNPHGVAYKEQLGTLQPADAETYFFATPWGAEYMALSYGLYVTQELGGFEPVDHLADFETILAGGDRLVTTPDMLYAYPREWWVERVGGKMHLRSAGPGFVEIDNRPLADAPEGDTVSLDNGVTLVGREVEPQGDGRFALALYWQADAPLETDYSVFVHLTSADPPAAPGDILAQADSLAPVSGWYPLTEWQPGEVVRDDYLIVAPEDYAGPLHLRVGMYRQLEDGSFENLDAFSQPVTS